MMCRLRRWILVAFALLILWFMLQPVLQRNVKVNRALTHVITPMGDEIDDRFCKTLFEDADNCRNNSVLQPLDQEDEKLIKIIKRCFVHSPQKDGSLPGIRARSQISGQDNQPVILDRLYKNKTNGYFVEVGARDGLDQTNTLLFEQERNWTGLLIEAEKKRFASLKLMSRKAYLVNTCVGTSRSPYVAPFDGEGIPQDNALLPRDLPLLRRKEGLTLKPVREVVNLVCVQCLPLYSVLAAVGNPKIDLFSLDVEGAELPILRTLPFDKVNIKVFLTETLHIGEVFKEGTKEQMDELMKNHGYRKLNTHFEKDFIFVKNGTEGIDESFLTTTKKLPTN